MTGTEIRGITHVKLRARMGRPDQVREVKMTEVDCLPMTDGSGRFALFIETEEDSIQLRGTSEALGELLGFAIAEVASAGIRRALGGTS